MNTLTRTTHLQNLVQTTKDRIKLAIDIYPKVFVSFSGGKDSTVLCELVRQVCEENEREFIAVFNDIETIAPEVSNFIKLKKERFNVHILQSNTVDKTNGDLPTWKYWDEDYKDLWCKPQDEIILPKLKFNWYNVFDYYFQNKSNNLPYCNFIGIRGQESFHRNMATSRTKKNNPIPWLYDQGLYGKCYPIYDWKWQDIWDFLLEHDLGYNKTYDYWADAKIKHSKSRTGALYCASETNKPRWKTFFIYEKYNPEFFNKIINRFEALGVDFEKYRK